MKTKEPLAWLTALSLLLPVFSLAAEEAAVVKDNRVNVRGQPSLVGEVITQLQAGERVVVLEEITIAKPKPNEPPRWARIQMPANTPVWVYAPLIDPASKSVNASRLNLRAGPGENYSIVGRLQRGNPVQEIRRVEDWMEIETPPGAYAFVAADLLSKPGATEIATPVPAAEQAPDRVDPIAVPPPVLAESQPADTAPADTPPPATASPTESPIASVTQPDSPRAQQPEPRWIEQPQADSVRPAVPPPATEVPASVDQTRPPADPTLQRRVVRREGIVRSTASIQAPTYFELLSPENRKTINYMHAESLGLPLKDYRGRRIVVTGEEVIDPRWPKTPVIEVETLELIP